VGPACRRQPASAHTPPPPLPQPGGVSISTPLPSTAHALSLSTQRARPVSVVSVSPRARASALWALPISPVSFPTTTTPTPSVCAPCGQNAPTPQRLAPRTSPGRQGEDHGTLACPAPHSLSPCPLPSPSSQCHHRRCLDVPPSSPGLCHCLGHGELCLRVVPREPTSVSPSNGPSAPSASDSRPAQTGDRRRRVSLSTSPR
jgi:hypothetical protein